MVKLFVEMKKLYGYEIVEELREKYNLDKINIIGLSWGSMITLDYAQQYPEYLNKIILISPGRNGWNYFQDKNAQKNFEKRKIAKANNDKIKFVEYFQKNWTDGPSQDSTRIKM